MQTPASSRPPSLVVSTQSEAPTNTLIVPSLPLSFFNPLVLEALRNHFASYGDLYAWIPLKGFRRILVVYMLEDDADSAREIDGLIIKHEPLENSEGPDTDEFIFTLRVYRGDPTLITRPANDTLRPPEIEHNYLISPPGSPPLGWEQVREEPPNTATLAEDLVRALEALRIERELAGKEHEPHVLVSAGDGTGGMELPRVTVQHADHADSMSPGSVEDVTEWNVGLSSQLRSLRTSRPPVSGE